MLADAHISSLGYLWSNLAAECLILRSVIISPRRLWSIQTNSKSNLQLLHFILMLKAVIPLNLGIQSTHLSQDVAEKLSGLMPSRFSSEVVDDELLFASAALYSIPVFRLE